MSNFGVPTDEQLTKINKLAKRTLSKDEVFVFSGKSAGDLLIPNRYTKLSPELLQVMIEDAKKGVSFMLNHNWSNWGGIQGIPYGKVFDGRIIPSSAEGETVEMHLDKFIVRDDEIIDGVSANALIKRIETGILSDTSIGFSTDRMTCSICGMNYYSRDCNHYRGGTYTMEDGSKKVCTLTAMPPSIIIPYNNNSLFEESIVWDGAYPGAVVTQSKHGDIIETTSGKFSILEDKEELPENTPLLGHYHNGDIVTMVKKSEHKKIFKGAKIQDDNLEGSEKSMDEKLLNALIGIGFTNEEAEALNAGEVTTALNAMIEKWENSIKVAEPQEGVFMAQDQVTEKLGTELSADEVLKLAKEGQEYRKNLSDEAIAMGVRAMGNDFTKETWEKSFTTMSTNDIKNIMKTWELQANVSIPAGRKTDPAAGQVQTKDLPDEAFKVGK
ncbi:hypothetical protein CIW83_09680 [Tissierella sp. P1]|uniref:hypothetical protein n=1 Tax=Tissierella sp. P1 TaxID=1280483 RepID=UPI000BA08ACF|nr:hypothetical protein [Tissierella sp. P1]OZV12357.1 hypothetical protein CIW83_09680 [Tissierella sp. P1]